jgi:uncharacterized protein
MNHCAAAISFGSVMHERYAPARNRFAYRIFTLRLPLSQLQTLQVAGLGINRRGLLSFHERDHGPRDGSPLLPWISEQLHDQGLAELCDGEVVLQTLPRLFGYVFNPVSFWFCHDRAGQLRAVLAEVSNTFGGHHNYLVAHPDARVIGSDDVLQARKLLHVSPFFPVRGEYAFRFQSRSTHDFVAIDYYDEGIRMLSTRMSGQRIPLSARSLLAAWLRCPMLTFGVIARIHWQALRLLLKRVPFLGAHLKPAEQAE